MIELVIQQRRRDLGSFEVGRVLPFARRRMVGPYIFFDRMGPKDLAPGLPREADVRPHPHIGLSTITYLYDGEIMQHRDSLGARSKLIRPGEVNWMTAGRGITHSERFERCAGRAGRSTGSRRGWRCPTNARRWIRASGTTPSEALPVFDGDGVVGRLIAGRLAGVTSPVRIDSPQFYVHWRLRAGSRVSLPAEYPERAVYVASGEVELEGQRVEAGAMAVLTPGKAATISALGDAVVMALGGEPVGPRYIDWNFVSSSKARIDQARRGLEGRAHEATRPGQRRVHPAAAEDRPVARTRTDVMSRNTMQADRYDILVLGSGEAGKYIAWTLAKAGRRAAVVERGLIGGSCPNIACLPSKNVIYSARVAALCRRGAEFGITTGPIAIDMRGVRQRKRQMVDDLIAVHRKNYANSGAELIIGEGRFVAPKTIEVRAPDGGVRQLAGERVFIDVGTRAALPDVPGLAECKPLTHVEALDLDHVPEHLIVLGGGYVGLEFAQPMRRFGARVTLLERGPQLAAREDPDVAEVLAQQFADDGIEVVLDAQTLEVAAAQVRRFVCEFALPQASGPSRAANCWWRPGACRTRRSIGLDVAGVELDERGYIQVNERLETTAPNVWAVGDCAGSPQFTHAGFDDFRIVRDNLAGGERTTRDRLVPYCMFTDPELGRVGLNESAAQRAGVAYRIAKIPMTAVLRTRTLSEPRGFLKALIAADSDRILGFTALGAEAGELIAVVQTAMLTNTPYTTLRDAILTHPTIAEGLTVLFASEPAPQKR